MTTVSKINYSHPNDYDYLIKCLIIGDSGIGKSSVMCRFADDVFTPEYISTIGVDFKIRTIEYNSKILKLQIWDTAGQERFRTITTSYYRGSHAIVICYDITDSNTFANVDMWLDDVKKYASKSPILVLCGTKFDLSSERQVSISDAMKYAKLNNMIFIETSAKDGTNVLQLFELISSAMVDKYSTLASDIPSNSNIIIQPSKTKHLCTC
jgi:Ras-related protein Rab-1A